VNDADVYFSSKDFFRKKENQDALIDSNFFVDDFLTQYNSMIEKIEKNIQESSFQSVDEMKKQLEGIENIEGLSHFSVGSTLVVSKKIIGPSGKKENAVMYGEITSITHKGYFTLLERGVDQYDSNLTKVSRITYSSFIDFATQSKG